jgi:uncharacterized Zn finger protein (UPF0148 family)
MEEVVMYCPNCHRRVLAADSSMKGYPAHQVPTDGTFFCPSCEMFVQAVEGPDSSDTDPAAHAIDVPSDAGRARAAGSNAGGSQRGDLSDQGATQWRKDPGESERNTWSDKSR